MKKLDLDFYLPAKNDFIASLKRKKLKKWDEFNNELSLYCACFGLPVFVAIIFAEEAFPEFQMELGKKKEIVRGFYGYE